MSCPECGKDHPAGPCSATSQGHEMDYVSILETTDTQVLTIIESVLNSAGIPFVVQGQEGLGLLPVGVAGSAAHLHGLGATVHVPRDLETEARALLETLDTPDGESSEGPDSD